MNDQKEGTAKKVVFPLNSRRLKLYQMQQLAQVLELPIKAPSNDLRVIVEEKLRVMDQGVYLGRGRGAGCASAPTNHGSVSGGTETGRREAIRKRQ